MQQNYKHISSHSTIVLIRIVKKHFATEWYRITAYILSQKWSFLSHNFLSHLKQLRTLLPYLLRYLSMLSSNLHWGLHTLSSHVLFNIHMQVTCLCCSSQTHCPYRPNICYGVKLWIPSLYNGVSQVQMLSLKPCSHECMVLRTNNQVPNIF